MSDKSLYFSGGRGRGQSSAKRTGYSVGNLVIDRKGEGKRAKVDTKAKPVVATDSKNVIEKVKQRQLHEVVDTRQGDATTEIDNDTPVDDEQSTHQEQILENVMRSYKEGNNDSKY